MLSPVATPRAQRRPKRSVPKSENEEKENACRSTPKNRPFSHSLTSTPLSPRAPNQPESPLLNLKQRRLQDLQKCIGDSTVGSSAQVLEEISKKRIGTPLSTQGRRSRLKVPSLSVESTESRKRRFGDVTTSLSVAEETDTNEAKRLHQSPDPSAAVSADKPRTNNTEKNEVKRVHQSPNPAASISAVKSRTNNTEKNEAKRVHQDPDPTAGISAHKSRINDTKPNPFDRPLPGTSNTGPNPFDYPLQPTKTTAAPIKSYAKSSQTRRIIQSSETIKDTPPVRELISYADLWEGVSCIEPEISQPSLITYDPNFPMYDFLYNGIWKRRCGNTTVNVGKRRRVFWRGDCWYGGWCRIGSCAERFGSYHDLDCPHVQNFIVCGD